MNVFLSRLDDLGEGILANLFSIRFIGSKSTRRSKIGQIIIQGGLQQ